MKPDALALLPDGPLPERTLRATGLLDRRHRMTRGHRPQECEVCSPGLRRHGYVPTPVDVWASARARR